MPIVSHCPVCDSAACRVLLDGVDEELTLAEIGSSRSRLSHGRILRCRDCQFAFRALRPGEDELARLYRDADIATYERELPYRTRTARRYRRIVTRHFAAPGSLLDVGCASGQFLKTMTDAGWSAWGVEPSSAEFRLARQLLAGRAVLQNTTLQAAAFEGRRFDAITFWDVLEHMADPAAFLAQCAALLKPGGRVFFTVPNMDSWQARWMKERWPMLLAEHLNYFNPRSLRLCCERAGLALGPLGRRPVVFSAGYVMFRLGQHRYPGMNLLRQALDATRLSRLPLPVYMGDMVGICQAAAAAQQTRDFARSEPRPEGAVFRLNQKSAGHNARAAR